MQNLSIISQNNQQLATSSTVTALVQTKPDRILAVLKLANLARNGKENLLDDQELNFISVMIKEDHPWLPQEKLIEIMKNGIKGRYNKDDSYVPINSMTIYRWLEKAGVKPNDYKTESDLIYSLFDYTDRMHFSQLNNYLEYRSRKITAKEWVEDGKPDIEQYKFNKLSEEDKNVYTALCQELEKHGYNKISVDKWEYEGKFTRRQFLDKEEARKRKIEEHKRREADRIANGEDESDLPF